MKRFFWVFICLSFSFKSDHFPFMEVAPSFMLVAPVTSEMSVTGSFGELRNNHFHAGIDLRAGSGLHGDDILSAADGYISKIIIDSDDYGKSMYIAHPNGMMTVYGHLNDFRKDISEYIKAKQYLNKSFQLELKFDPDDFPVKAGEQVAFMGNTGASRGKHLHFELRNASGEEVWDPFSFGLHLKDEIKPIIRRIKVYGYDVEGDEVSSKVYSKSMIEKNLTTIEIPGDVFSVGLDAMDRSNNSWNYIGIKSIKMMIDGGMFYHYSADKWRTDETKYINAHIDYYAKAAAKGQFHRCFILSGNKMNLYHSLQNDGFFFMSDSMEHEVNLVTGDANGNESEINFKIRKKPFITKVIASQYADVIYHDLEKTFIQENAELKYSAGSVYENLNCELRTFSNTMAMSYSNWVSIFPYSNPVHLKAEIKLKAEKSIPNQLMNKCFMAIKRGASVQSIGGQWNGNYLQSKARSFGPYSIMMDTLAPSIKPILNKKKKFPKGEICFRLSDNIPTAKELPDIYYEASVDGQWVLMEYDKKTSLIRHKFEDWLSLGSHNYEILVRDVLGNQKIYKGSFIR